MGSYQNQRYYLSPVANRHSVDCCLIGNRLCAESFDMRTRLNLVAFFGNLTAYIFSFQSQVDVARKNVENVENLTKR
jgi:hypothetical protein